MKATTVATSATSTTTAVASISTVNVIVVIVALGAQMALGQILDPTVNTALRKPVSALLTCGTSGPERFTSQVYAGISQATNSRYCNGTAAYPPEAIVDGNPDTWWQSTSRINFVANGYGINGGPDAVISVDLQQSFTVERLEITFGESLRPGRMTFYRSPAGGGGPATTDWFYVVTTTTDCRDKYGVNLVSQLTQVATVNDRPCIAYKNAAVLNEKIVFDISGTNTNVKEWNSATSVRVAFYDIYLSMGVTPNAYEFQHYTVRSLDVFAKCKCNGQLTDCRVDSTTGRYSCVCGNFTTGENCQTCLDLYNNRPYEYGRACQACDCSGHANSCIYDPGRGMGVCQNCQNLTEGPKCDQCVWNFYRPLGVPATAPNPCVPCNCSGVYVVGGCLPAADDKNYPGMNPGECYCKPNVEGPRCDRCKSGFFGLSDSGCRDCSCSPNGTVAGTKSCDDGGQCPCKSATWGLRCDTCLDGFYNLDANNPNGCSACACDVGGSLSLTCDKTTGQCSCRRNVVGRTCNQPAPGFYYPGFYFLSAEMENLNTPWESGGIPDSSGFGYVKTVPQVPVSTTISLTPMGLGGSDTFKIVLRYSFPSTTPTTGIMTVAEGNAIKSSSSFSLAACSSSWCLSLASDAVKLSRTFQSTVSFTLQDQVYIDRISAVPTEYFDAPNIFPAADLATFQSTCNLLSTSLYVNGFLRSDCAKYEFSLSTWYLNGALACNCDVYGANDTSSCQPAGGQCYCKAGTTGRQCGSCLPRYYSLGPSGCSPCTCNQTTYNMCDPLTGSCLCPPGTEGAKCESCKVNHYNWDAVKGCLPCGCNALGSRLLNCDVANGRCTCKPGVAGVKCEMCDSGYKEMTAFGCSPCNCDPAGTLAGTFCDTVTGNCKCKANVGGTLCNSCKLDSFTLSPTLADGCLSCLCMGVSPSCSMANYLPHAFNVRPSALTFNVSNGDGTTSSVFTLPKPATKNGLTFATIDLPPSQNVYWSDPQLHGNMLTFYGASILFKVFWKAQDASLTTPSQNSVIVVGKNGQSINFRLVNYTLPASDVVTQLKSILTLENTPDFATSGLTRAKILMTLTDVRAVLLPATYKSTMHQSGIADVYYELNSAYVEQCFCPPGYEGRSCETCSTGYMRYNVTEQGFFGLCKPCDCNAKSTSCDPLTGFCSNCQQFTTGLYCESCLPGYYRDPGAGPSAPCTMCPCEGSRVTSPNCTAVNGTVVCSNCSVGYLGNKCDQCAAGYFGNPGGGLMGVCSPCTCNGFAGLCDSLGVCQNCSNFTTGSNCERCLPQKFKDPTTGQCIDCNCNATGSQTNECDIQTGQCQCKSGIASLKCDVCMEHYYNFSSSGCLACNCNELGSANLSCDGSGRCFCRPNVQNLTKCDQCEEGSFGILNGLPCQICNCNPLGVDTSVVNFANCNKTTGQCACKANVMGRTCDRCELMYYNRTENLDCTACTGCSDSLGKDVARMASNAQTKYLPLTEKISSLGQLYVEFATLEARVGQICRQLGGCSNASSNLYTTFNSQLDEAKRKTNADVEKTLDVYYSQEKVVEELEKLDDKVAQANELIVDLKSKADRLAGSFVQSLSAAQANLRTLKTYNETADKIWKNPPYNGSNSNYLVWRFGGTFDRENASLFDLYSRTQLAIDAANQLLASLGTLINPISQMMASLASSKVEFTNTSNQIKSINDSLQTYNMKLTDRTFDITKAIALRDSFNQVYRSTLAVVRSMDSMLTTTAINLAVCKQRLDGVFSLIAGDNSAPAKVLADTGFQGWNQAYSAVDGLLRNYAITLNASLPTVAAVEQKAAALSAQAANILSSFQGVQSRGQSAVDVVNRFQGVISNLQTAIGQAQGMDATLQNIIRSLNSFSLSDLAVRSSQLLTSTNVTKQNLDSFLSTTSASGLSGAVDSANVSLQASVALWKDIDAKLVDFNKKYLDFQTFIADTVRKNNQYYNDGRQISDALGARLAALRQSNDRIQVGLSSAASSIGNVAATISNSLVIQSQLLNNFTSFQAVLDATNASSTFALNVSQATVQPRRIPLVDQFSRVDDLLKQAQAKLSALEQPVFFSGTTFEAVANPDANANQLYNSVGLEFSYATAARGILFFAENTQSQEKLLVQLVNNSVCFEFSFTDVKTLLCNAAQLSAGNWFRVYVTRYETDAKLTVEQMSTGGVLSVSARAASTNSLRISLNSQIYVGGLALNSANILKVYNSGAGFSGCIYNVQYNGAPLPVWQSVLRTTSTASCCKKPSPPSRLAYLPDCITLYGFGHVMYAPRDTFSLLGQAQVSFQFRTFGRSGVLFLVPSFVTSDYYGIFVQSGKVVFSISSGTFTTSLVTDNSCNNGQWFRVTASHNQLSMTLTVAAVSSSQTETKTIPAVVTLNSLVGINFVVGGQHPNFVRGPVTNGFSGSIKEFQHTTTFSSMLLPDSLTTGINSSANVDLTRCLENVQAGLGLLNRSSYALINPLVSSISAIDFTFVTRAFSGILYFANLEKTSDQNAFLYVCLYNGDIFVIFNQGPGLQPTFRTRNLYLSDGLEHRVTLTFIYTNSPRMKVDNLETHVGALAMSAYMRLADGNVYVGGIPAAMSLDGSVLPVKMSFVGGMKQISFNDVPVQFYDPAILNGANSRAVYLSGIQLPLPPAPPPCNPCPTTPAPQACVLPAPSNNVYGNNTFGFSVETENYVQYNISGDESIFSTLFQCSVQFRTLQPDGLMLYVSGPAVQTPLNYFAVYLTRGYVNAVVMNGSALMSVASKNAYYDGEWHKINVYLTANSLAISVLDSEDFNSFRFGGTSTLLVSSPLYIGGIPYVLSPFPDAIKSGKASFKGCLQDVIIQSASPKILAIVASKITARKGVSPCSTDAKMGMSIASSGYVRVSDSYNSNPLFDLAPPFSIFLSFKTSATYGVLAVAWSSPSKFVSMSIVGGEIQVILSSVGQPFVFTSRAFKSGYSVCNNVFHSVTMTINVASVTLAIDSNYTETKSFDTFQYAAPLSVPLYVGGVRDPSWNIPGIFSSVGFVGCLQRCRVNGNDVYITQSADVNGAVSGCV